MKKFISLFLVFSILALSMPLTAKERRGANIEIYKTKQVIKLRMEGTPWGKLNIEPDIRGELIAIKENSLILLERDSGTDVTVDIGNIGVIKIVKKSKAGVGLLWGVVIGAYVGYYSGSPEEWVGVGVFGALIGLVIGAFAGKDEIIAIAGKSDSEIQEILEKLRKKARVRNVQ